MSRIQIFFSDQELNAIRILAEMESRDIKSQIALIVRQDLQRRCLLPVQNSYPINSNPQNNSSQEESHEHR
jgi:hypothetical protein